MTAPRSTLDATNQAEGAARIAAVVLAVFVAIAVAGLFLVLIGADRRDRLVAPSSAVGHAQMAKPQAAASPLSTLGPGGTLGTSQNRARTPHLNNQRHPRAEQMTPRKKRKGKEEK